MLRCFLLTLGGQTWNALGINTLKPTKSYGSGSVCLHLPKVCSFDRTTKNEFQLKKCNSLLLYVCTYLHWLQNHQCFCTACGMCILFGHKKKSSLMKVLRENQFLLINWKSRILFYLQLISWISIQDFVSFHWFMACPNIKLHLRNAL